MSNVPSAINDNSRLRFKFQFSKFRKAIQGFRVGRMNASLTKALRNQHGSETVTVMAYWAGQSRRVVPAPYP